jgi:hypothetical protein
LEVKFVSLILGGKIVMRFNEIVAITGMPGLFYVETQKASGLIVTSLTEGWTKFVSGREHMFTMLDNFSIYTDQENIELLDALLIAYKKKAEHPPVDAKAGDAALKEYFALILPNYDREKVHISDIKKFVKWFAILDEKGILQTEAEELSKAETEKESENSTEKAEKDADNNPG